MAKYGFLDALDDELARNFTYDYEINWDKKHHAVEIFYLLDVENPGVAVTDTADDEAASSENISFEDAVVFYNPHKSKLVVDDYLAMFPYEPKTGLADNELDALMDFLSSDQVEFSGTIDLEKFKKEVAELSETEFLPYPRY